MVESFYKPLTFQLAIRGAFFSYVRKFVEKKTPMGLEIITKGIDQTFQVNEQVMIEFQSHVDGLDIEYTPADFEEARAQMKRELEREIHASLWGIEAGWRAFQLYDPAVRKALEVFPQAEQLVRGN